ncbi:unnamed protein product [Polarella glacialis]|uniref:Methyltransferase domain-containing protein n=1 Tax=Polarella glacialis TaxID=89957 RepID=A0A813HFB2_POLGL|nr:unnamed protein product [Polarella glacialis]
MSSKRALSRVIVILVQPVEHSRMTSQVHVLLCLLVLAPAVSGSSDHKGAAECLSSTFPESRSDFPLLLNCLGLVKEAVEVGVQAGVHAKNFLEGWHGQRLRLVDLWHQPSQATSDTNHFYVDIANIHGADVRRQHRAHCEARMEESLRLGRAEIVNKDSILAASEIQDGELDFVYLDARHDFTGVVDDIRAWWPKVRVGGIFAGHDFVDGEFPEGDFFWISALREVLPGIEQHTHVTRERNRFPSFFILKTEAVSSLVPREVDAEAIARALYTNRSRYFKLWQEVPDETHRDGGDQFLPTCRHLCGQDCDARLQEFTPTRTAGSTLRPFACGKEGRGLHADGIKEDGDISCGVEVSLDAEAYHSVCLDRCNVTCEQRTALFSTFGAFVQ